MEFTRLAPPSLVTEDTDRSVVSAVTEASSFDATLTLPPADTVLSAAIVVIDAKSIEASTVLLIRFEARMPLTDVPEAFAIAATAAVASLLTSALMAAVESASIVTFPTAVTVVSVSFAVVAAACSVPRLIPSRVFMELNSVFVGT